MSITSICKKDVISVSVDSSIKEAAALMKKNNIGDVLVKNGERLVGILTDRDIVVRLTADDVDFNKVKVSDVMSEKLFTLKNSLNVTEAIEMLSRNTVRRAPILDEEGNVCGIVSLDDLLVLLAEQLHKVTLVLQKQIHH